MKRTSARRLAYLGLAWSISYLPIHIYWALGGLSRPIGIDGSQHNFRTANWGACFVILGAGLICLALVHPWGQLLPRTVRAGSAWIGGVFAGLHWAVFTVASVLRLVGVVDYPRDGHPTGTQSRAYDWWNIGYFELWFGVMGVLLIGCAVLTRPAPDAPAQLVNRLGSAVTLAGVATVIRGVFTFNAWVFALAGPAVLGVGLLTLWRTPQPAVLEGSPS